MKLIYTIIYSTVDVSLTKLYCMRNSVDSNWCPVVILVGLSIYLNCATLSRHVEGGGGERERDLTSEWSSSLERSLGQVNTSEGNLTYVECP